MNTSTNTLKSTIGEKISYAFGDVGGNVIWSFTSAFLTLYYTDSVGLSAAAVGTMMLICRIFDGISDILMGTIIDKTKTRWGKARPWILFSAVPLVVIFLAVFNVPSGFGTTGQNIYVFVTYFALTVICATAQGISYHALLPRFSLTSQDRTIATIIRTIFAMGAIMGLNIATPILLNTFGGDTRQNAWTTLTFFYGAAALISLCITFFGVKEKLPVVTEKEKKQKKLLMPAVKSLLTTRYFYLAVALFLTYYTTSGAQGIGIYYARDVLGDANIYGIISLIMILPTLFFMPFVPFLFKKIGKRNAMMIGLIIAVLASAATLINPRNISFYLILGLVRTIGVMPLSVAIFTLSGDIVDYRDMTTGIRAEGIATSANSMGTKLGTGLGSALLGWILAWGHYDGTLAVQPDSAIKAMIIMGVVVPLAVYAVAFVLLLFWDLDKYQPRVQEYLKKKTQEDAR